MTEERNVRLRLRQVECDSDNYSCYDHWRDVNNTKDKLKQFPDCPSANKLHNYYRMGINYWYMNGGEGTNLLDDAYNCVQGGESDFNPIDKFGLPFVESMVLADELSCMLEPSDAHFELVSYINAGNKSYQYLPVEMQLDEFCNTHMKNVYRFLKPALESTKQSFQLGEFLGLSDQNQINRRPIEQERRYIWKSPYATLPEINNCVRFGVYEYIRLSTKSDLGISVGEMLQKFENLPLMWASSMPVELIEPRPEPFVVPEFVHNILTNFIDNRDTISFNNLLSVLRHLRCEHIIDDLFDESGSLSSHYTKCFMEQPPEDNKDLSTKLTGRLGCAFPEYSW